MLLLEQETLTRAQQTTQLSVTPLVLLCQFCERETGAAQPCNKQEASSCYSVAALEVTKSDSSTLNLTGRRFVLSPNIFYAIKPRDLENVPSGRSSLQL